MKKFPNLVYLTLDAIPHSNFNRLANINKPVFITKVLKSFIKYLADMKSFSIKNLQVQNMDEAVHVFQEFLLEKDLCVKHKLEDVFSGISSNILTLESSPNYKPTMNIVSRIGGDTLESLIMIEDIGISLSGLHFECSADDVLNFLDQDQELEHHF
ncbi:hypothetical protein CU098_013563 [Rhizopus stolonifer]|uniref:Uncharacterized protein n=1 Tax=Rhizopus stolonifer TaxID=4846 RepID=A0A367KVQ8_RHIST|nr:hypothetical protein CU098_013563 [Rhizopus stolonifer]